MSRNPCNALKIAQVSPLQGGLLHDAFFYCPYIIYHPDSPDRGNEMHTYPHPRLENV